MVIGTQINDFRVSFMSGKTTTVWVVGNFVNIKVDFIHRIAISNKLMGWHSCFKVLVQIQYSAQFKQILDFHFDCHA